MKTEQIPYDQTVLNLALGRYFEQDFEAQVSPVKDQDTGETWLKILVGGNTYYTKCMSSEITGITQSKLGSKLVGPVFPGDNDFESL
jgi:hypothetical protein